MKKLFSFIVAAMSCVMAFLPSVDMKAWEVTQDGITYEANNLTGENPYIYVSKASNLSGNIVMPSYFTINGKEVPVTLIYYNAFAKQSGVFSITTPGTLKTIEHDAFNGATGLQEIVLNDGLTEMDGYIFKGCTGLKRVHLPTTISALPGNIFAQCTALQEIAIPENIQTIRNYAFLECSNLKSVYGLQGVTKIGAHAFDACPNLSYLPLEQASALVEIGEYAFFNCTLLEKLTIPASVTKIGNFAFNNAGLKELTVLRKTPLSINANVIAGLAYAKCVLIVPKGCKEAYKNAEVWKKFGTIIEEGEESVAPIPTGEQKIGNLYYDLHEDLTATVKKHADNKNLSGELTIPASVSYGDYTYRVTGLAVDVFASCTKLTSVKLQNTGITAIPVDAFYGCTALTSVYFPSTLTTIGEQAFYECGKLTEFYLPSGLTEIGKQAFRFCTSLKAVSIPAKVASLPNACFGGCSSLSKVTFAEGLTSIGEYCFNGCPLTTVVLPASLNLLSEGAFANCSSLESVRVKRTTPPTTDLKAFNGVNLSYLCILYVPAGSKSAYENAAVWKEFKEIREKGVSEKIKYGKLYYKLNEDYTAWVTWETQNENNYADLSGEVTVEPRIDYQGMSYRVEAVGGSAFKNCKGITKVNLPQQMDEEISKEAFKNCSNLAEINIPKTLRILQESAFEGTKLYNDNIDGDGAVYYDGCLLYGPNSSYSGEYVVKDGTRLLATNSLSGYNHITSLILPEGVECICNYAISYMYALKKLSLPSTIEFIGGGLCNDCFYLNEIYNYSKTPYDLSDVYCFDGPNQNQCTLYVPKGTKAAYSAAEEWKQFPIMEMKGIYTVTFEDYDGNVLKTEHVEEGKDAHAPSDPSREGYDFTGWDETFTNVQEDLTVTAQYTPKTYTVTFMDGLTNEIIDSQTVEYGLSATEPEVPAHEGYTFTEWDKEFDVILENTVVTALYIEKQNNSIESLVIPIDKPRKFLIEGIFYITTPNGVIYNANGVRL